jgi:hypothetical protein
MLHENFVLESDAISKFPTMGDMAPKYKLNFPLSQPVLLTIIEEISPSRGLRAK